MTPPESHSALDSARGELKAAVIEAVLARNELRLTRAGRSAISVGSDLAAWELVRIPTAYLEPTSRRGRLVLALADLTRVRQLRRFIPWKRARRR